jgi:hypothetical protein
VRDNHIATLILEDPDSAIYYTGTSKTSERGEYRTWHDFYWQVWSQIRYSRSYSSNGWESPVSFIAVENCARRAGVKDDDFELFYHFISAIDEEWLDYVSVKLKAAAARK